jgi:hypothetical protein
MLNYVVWVSYSYFYNLNVWNYTSALTVCVHGMDRDSFTAFTRGMDRDNFTSFTTEIEPLSPQIKISGGQ